MRHKVTKAIFPVAGLGTRFLPATKSVPKEIMTLVDRPLVQYAIDEAREAGIKEFLFITSRGKGALEDYFDHSPQLEQELKRKGKDDLLEILKSTNMDSGEVAYIRQHKALGLGHAVWCARRLIGNEPFAVILPDDVIAAEKPCLQQMVEAYEETGGNMVAAMEVPADKASSYGILDVLEDMGSIVSVKGMVEKPEKGTAPSNLAVIGRYILSPQILKNLNKMRRAPAERSSSPMPSPRKSVATKVFTASASVVSGSIAARRRASCRRRSPSVWPATSLATTCAAYLHEVIAADKAAE